MQLSYSHNRLTVTREDTDKKYYGTGNAAGESNFLYDLKEKLNSIGFNLIKKRMWKDGHMVDDMQQYLRTTDKRAESPHIYLTNDHWAITGLNDDFNNGEAELYVTHDVYEVQPDCEERMVKLIESVSVEVLVYEGCGTD